MAFHILLTCYTGRAVVSAGLWVALVVAAYANEKEGRRSRPCSTRGASKVIHRSNARAYREESPVGQGLWWLGDVGQSPDRWGGDAAGVLRTLSPPNPNETSAERLPHQIASPVGRSGDSPAHECAIRAWEQSQPQPLETIFRLLLFPLTVRTYKEPVFYRLQGLVLSRDPLRGAA